MKKLILIIVSGFLMLIFLNAHCLGGDVVVPPPYTPGRYSISIIELSGLQYDKLKVEISEFSENINDFYYKAYITVAKLKELTGTITINNKKIKFDNDQSYDEGKGIYLYKLIRVKNLIEAKKPIIMHIGGITKLYYLGLTLQAETMESIVGKTYFYRLKVNTDGLKANKNLFDKKIEFTPEEYFDTHIRINILNKKVDIKYTEYYDTYKEIYKQLGLPYMEFF